MTASNNEREMKLTAADILRCAGVKKPEVRLKWLIAHKAIVYETTRMASRRGGFERENMEKVWTCDFESFDGSDIMLGVDGGFKSSDEAIDAAISYEEEYKTERAKP